MWRLLRQTQDAGDVKTALAVYQDLIAALKPQQGAAAAEALGHLAQEPVAALHMADTPLAPALEPIAPIPGRAAYLLNYALPQVANGYTLRSQAIAAALQNHGVDLACLTRPGFPLDRSPTRAFRPADQVADVEYLHEALPVLEGFSGFSAYLAAAADALETRLRALRPQAVIAASNFQIALPGLIAARRLGLPFCYEVRGFWEVTQLSADPGIEATLFFQLQYALECRTAAQADHVFTLAAPMQEELIQRGVSADKIILAPNGCDTAKFVPLPRNSALAARYEIPENVPVIGYIGSFVQYEGLDDLVRACSLLRQQGLDFRLLLAGSGPAEEDIRHAASDAGLEDWLILPGRIPHEEAAAHYSLIDITPFPRKPQPVTELVPPLKPLEAMAMEKAVVVSSVRPLADMVTDGETGIVFKKGDTEDLTRTLAQLIAGPALRIRLGKAGRKWVAQERSWSQAAMEIARIIGSPVPNPGIR
ncbi:glycosyltransferase family 4 protein [Leisingera sp. F5]|uniref:glycosyltransferase family 4 protein n=1 Tax=Leisingera sp. F5 TaxID=1813816 RepID=UPI000AA965E6|nr:glycosyltransferase family 4 protein [Leisingera sp. F5]